MGDRSVFVVRVADGADIHVVADRIVAAGGRLITLFEGCGLLVGLLNGSTPEVSWPLILLAIDGIEKACLLGEPGNEKNDFPIGIVGDCYE